MTTDYVAAYQRLMEFLADVESMTAEEIDEELRAFGYDPEEVGRRGAEFAAEQIEKLKREQEGKE
jgi:putative aminopeptidase FrvX